MCSTTACAFLVHMYVIFMLFHKGNSERSIGDTSVMRFICISPQWGSKVQILCQASLVSPSPMPSLIVVTKPSPANGKFTRQWLPVQCQIMFSVDWPHYPTCSWRLDEPGGDAGESCQWGHVSLGQPCRHVIHQHACQVTTIIRNTAFESRYFYNRPHQVPFRVASGRGGSNTIIRHEQTG